MENRTVERSARFSIILPPLALGLQVGWMNPGRIKVRVGYSSIALKYIQPRYIRLSAWIPLPSPRTPQHTHTKSHTQNHTHMILGSRGDPYKNTCPLKRGIPGIFHTTFRIQVFWEVFLAGALAFWYLGSRGFRLEHYLTAAGGWGVHLHYAQQHTRKSEEKEYTSASSTQILQASLINIFLLSKSPQINWNISWSSNCDPFWKNRRYSSTKWKNSKVANMQLKAVLATNIRARCYFYEDDVTRNLSTSRQKSTSNCQWTRKEKKF